MDSQQILIKINNKDLHILNDIQLLVSSEKDKIDCAEICRVLRALYQAVVPSSTLEVTDAQRTVFDLIPSINLCIDHARHSYSSSDLVKHQFFPVLYHIIRTFLKVELYHPAVSSGNILKTLLLDPKNDFDDKMTYFKNMSVIFWNEALQTEKNPKFADPNTAFMLRTASIEFILLDRTNLDTVNEKISLSLLRFCQSNGNIDTEQIGIFLQNMWSHLEGLDCSYDHKAFLYKTLYSWLEILLKYSRDFSSINIFVTLFQTLACFNKKEDFKVLNSCASISKLCIQYFILQESDTKFKNICSQHVEFCKSSEQWNDVESKILAYTCGIIYITFFKCFRSLKIVEDNSPMFVKSDLDICVMLVQHYIEILSEDHIKKYVSLNENLKFYLCHTLMNLVPSIFKKEQCENQKKKLIKEIQEFINFTQSKLICITEVNDMIKCIFGYGTGIARLGMLLYSSGLYSESCGFLEAADKFFSLCSSSPESNIDENQNTLWKTHEILVFSLFLSGCHEKALLVIAKTLDIHEKKTKEGFELWRKVKRDVVRNDKISLLSITVSDLLSKINKAVDVEKEIEFLVEEFKACKSERCNFEVEIIAVCQKLLSLPCPKAVRAYVLQEVITMPTNVSEKISLSLKKSLLEMSLEAIILYRDHLAENPADNAAKLYLSLIHFWLYHENLKKVHDVAEKESQNILKPASLKPKTEVQNDAGEENETCDIQPAHPLVCLSIENETFKNLELAIQLWNEVSCNWKDLNAIVQDKNVLDIIQATAEIFSCAVYDTKELKLWLLLQSASTAVGSKIHELNACLSLTNFLIRLGYLNKASCYLKLAEDNIKLLSNSESESVELKLQLAKSNYYLHTGKFDEGLEIVQEILKSPLLEKRFKSVKMLHIEALLLQSEYLSLPMKAFSNSAFIDYLQINSHIAALMEAVSVCKAVLKHLIEKQTTVKGYDLICFKPVLIKNLLRAHVQLGEVCFKAGEPRFARCYLQEALKFAESNILTYWSSKILLVLCHIDLMCDNFKDCQVKASGLKYILGKDVQNSLEILTQMQAKYSTPKPDNLMSPDSPDDMFIFSVPDITLSRHVKQAFIDKIDVMSSPVSKRLAKNKSDKIVQCSFSSDNFSINLLQLESSFLLYLLSQTESDMKSSETALQELLDDYEKLKNPTYLRNILASIKLAHTVKDPFFRFQSKPEVSLCTSILMWMLQSYCMKNDTSKAKDTINLAYSFLKRGSHSPNYSYPDIYAMLRYHDIRISLCEYFKISSSSSITYYVCPSVKSKVLLKKILPDKEHLVNSPNTPKLKEVPKIVISQHLKTEKCQAPLKKNLMNSNLKKDIEFSSIVEGSVQNCSPFKIFSSSDDDLHFESPYNSLTRASKTRSGPKQNSKCNKSDKNEVDVSYQFFKSKNDTLGVKSASDVWNLTLVATPKLGKENRKLRSAKTLLKPSLDVKMKTRSANSGMKISVKNSVKSKRSKKKSATPTDSPKFNKSVEQNESSFASSILSERKMSIEYARSSPLPKINKRGPKSKKNCLNFVSEEFSSDSVFFTPSKSIQAKVIPNLVDDLCKDLNSLVLSETKVSPAITAENLKEIIEELSDLKLLIQNSMPYPLYAHICRLLAVMTLIKPAEPLNNAQGLHCGFLLSEAFSISLRNVHIANMIYFKESELVKEKDIILRTLRIPHTDSLQMESFLKTIPENWTVVQVSAFHDQEFLTTLNHIPCPTKLLMTQYQKDSAPLIVSVDCSSDERFSSSFLAEFDKILQEGNLTMLNKDSKLWWNTRSSLDARLKELTKCMENIWLGCWKGMFLGAPQNEARIKQIQTTVDAICKSSPCSNKKLLQILVDSAQHLSKEQVSVAVSYLWNSSPEEEVHTKLCQSIRSISIALPETERHHVILILDQSIQALPWECMPVLSGVSVSRMPSLSILHAKLAMMGSESILDSGIDTSNTYYVLNPGGDLTHSQEYFQTRFEKQIKWNGTSGKAPSSKEYISAFKDHDLFVYCGHGTGRQYFENTSVDKLRLQSTSILMGCSSGRLRRLGRSLEPYGIVLRLLLSGCPSITANLWDITDKDIDRFTDRLLQSLVPEFDEVQSNLYNIAKATSVARSACKLRYLVGAAPVVYGFPIFAKNQR